MQPVYTKRRVIGLLGGSFNPAHEGHVHISLHALNTLGMHQVWWLVSPQNPLKPKIGMDPYEKRLTQTQGMARDRRILVSDIEAKLNTAYTVDTLEGLVKRFPGTQFVWLMGADNLAQFHRWRRWRRIMDMLPVVVFDRAPYSHTALRSKAWLTYGKFTRKNSMVMHDVRLPRLIFVHLKRHTASSTLMRKHLEKRPF